MKKILDTLALLFTIANVVVACWFYFTTDEVAVPMHWTTKGDMDAYGNTWTILVLSAVAVLLWIILRSCETHRVVNLPFRIKDKEAALPYIDRMLAWNNMLVTGVLLYVVVAVAQLIPFAAIVVWLLLLAIAVFSCYYTYKIYQCGR